MSASRRMRWRQGWVIAAFTLAAGWLGCTSETPAKLACSDPNPCVSAFESKGKCAQVPLTGTACVVPGTGVVGTCEAGVCASPTCQNVMCDDGNPCTVDTCDPASGKCEVVAAPPGTTCDKQVAPCSIQAGECKGPVCLYSSKPKVVPCDDGNPCTVDTCDPDSGCIHTSDCQLPVGLSGNCASPACDSAGKCTATVVNTGGACEIDSPCGPRFCTSQGTCEPDVPHDGEACFGQSKYSTPFVGKCQSGTCVLAQYCGVEAPAAVSNPCLTFSMDAAGKCAVSANVGKKCYTASPDGGCKTNAGTCDAQGLCVAEVTVGAACSLGECAKGICDANAKCVWSPQIGKSCGQGQVGCTAHTCGASGTCEAHIAVGKSCGNSGLACAPKLCTASGTCEVVNLPAGTTCTDNAPCRTAAGTCDGAGTCTGAPTPGADCTKSLSSFSEGCRKATCSEKGECITAIAPGAPCGNWCTHDGTCNSAGECVGKVAVDYPCWTPCGPWGSCGADGKCHTKFPTTFGLDSCQTGSCDATGLFVPTSVKPDGTACSHGCIIGGQCIGGYCIGEVAPALCDDGKACTEDACCGGIAKSGGSSLGNPCYNSPLGDGCYHKPAQQGSACGPPDACGKYSWCSSDGNCLPPYGSSTCPPPGGTSCNGCNGDYPNCQATICTEQGCKQQWVGDTLYTDSTCKGDFVCRQRQCVLAKP